MLAVPLTAAEQVPPSRLPPLRWYLTAALDGLSYYHEQIDDIDSCSLEPTNRVRVATLLVAAGGQPQGMDVCGLLFDSRDPFGMALRTGLGTVANSPGVPELIVHCATAAGRRPRATWSATARRLLLAQPAGPDCLRTILTTMPGQRTLSRLAARVLAGAIWASAQTPGPWRTDVLGDVAMAGGQAKGTDLGPDRVARTAIEVLAKQADQDAVTALTRVQATAKRRMVAKAATKALADVAMRRVAATQ
jgi:hypothetical protein